MNSKKPPEKIDILDKGFVRLVDAMGNDLSVVRAARVSYDADWRAPMNDGISPSGGDVRLINYLMENRHTSPFEAVVFTFEVKAPIFVLRQWHRHRTWSYNEISARYTELDEGFYVPRVEDITTQSTSSKQARTTEQHPNAVVMQDAIFVACKKAFTIYNQLLDQGCPRELARSVLPVAAYSRMFCTVSLHNLMHFLRLRLHPHSQYEIRVYAEALRKLAYDVVPVSMMAFDHQLKKEGDSK